MEKYNLDDEIVRFLRDSSRYYPDEPGGRTVEDERHCYERLCRAYQASIPDDRVLFTDSTVGVASGDLKIRTYEKPAKEAGVTADYFEETGLIHGYLRARHCSAKAGRSFTRICDGFHILGERIRA